MVPHLRQTSAALGPVTAGRIHIAHKTAALCVRSGQHVVHVRVIAVPADDIPLLGKRGLFVDVIAPVKLIHVTGNQYAIGVIPRAAPNAIARIDGRFAARSACSSTHAKCGACPNRLRERLTVLIRTSQPAKIRPVARTDTGHEKPHFLLEASFSADIARGAPAVAKTNATIKFHQPNNDSRQKNRMEHSCFPRASTTPTATWPTTLTPMTCISKKFSGKRPYSTVTKTAWAFFCKREQCIRDGSLKIPTALLPTKCELSLKYPGRLAIRSQRVECKTLRMNLEYLE